MLEADSDHWLPEWLASSPWCRRLAIYLLIQAIFGVLAFEWAWHKTRRIRKQHEIKFKDERFEIIKRHDTAKWARWKLYPGALLTLLTRIIILLLNGMMLVLIWKLLICCHDFKKKGPIRKGCRSTLIAFFGRLAARIQFFACGMSTYYSYKEDVDYSYYLGPDYKSKMSTKTTSTIVANHVSWLDAIVFGRRFMPSMAPKDTMRNVPLVNTYADAIGSLYIPRGGTREEKDKILSLIQERQELVENSEGTLPPLLIYPEGTTNNGSSIFGFRQGAFLSEKKIRPYLLDYRGSVINPAWDTIHFLPYIVLFLSSGCYTCHLTRLPDFEPTDYLFTTHAARGKERWEIYAWALRSVLAEHGNLTPVDLPFRSKMALSKYLNMAKNAIHPDEFKEDQV